MEKANFSPIQNYRKHKITTAFLGQKGVVEALVKLANPSKKQFFSGLVGLIKLDNGFKKTLAIHSESCEKIKVGDEVHLSLRLEAENLEGLKNYGLVAKLK